MTDKEFFQQLGQQLNCEPAALKAVEEVESGGKGGFIKDGQREVPQILFEGHIFYKLMRTLHDTAYMDKLCREYPSICYPKWDKSKYCKPLCEWERMALARTLNRSIANESASWGRFQIMGTNYKLCGCKSIEEFVQIMSTSSEKQMELFANFLKNSGCLPSLQAKNWPNFARRYNGAGYAQNKYDIKLAQAYDKYLKLGYNG